jgi:prepilin signal peptidase PulO-like enzyme (type II secretory pathway)
VNLHAFFLDAAAAACFAGAGWLGLRLAGALYGALAPAIDGPGAIAVPDWVFLAVAACAGFCIAVHEESPARVALLLVVVLALTVCAATDFRCGMIPDLFSVGTLAAVLAFSAAAHDWAPLRGALFGFVPFGAMALVSNGRGMGWGDVKLAALGGALLGLAGITIAVALAALAAYIVARTLGQLRRPIAFGPYLAISIGVGLAIGGGS